MKFMMFAVLIIGMIMGGHLAAWTFFGILTFVGLVGLIETTPPLKWLVYRTSALMDVVIFVATLAATAKLGVTITASLTITGLCFTFLYRPYIRDKKEKQEAIKHKVMMGRARRNRL